MKKQLHNNLLISIIRKLFLLFAILNLSIASAFNVNGIEYYIIPNTTNVAVSGNNGAYSGAIVIPSTVIYGSVTYSVTAIQGVAFYNCNNLTSVTIPNSVTSIGNDAFNNCTSLVSINIPSTVTSIGQGAFTACISLSSITIPDGITSIEFGTFYYCYSLTSIIIPDSVTSIGWYAFKACSSLTTITIPDSVTSIGQKAFDGCTSLISLSIPNSVTSIDNDVFNNCTSLTLVNCDITTPLVIDPSVFGNVNQNSCTLIVPACSVELYQIATVWQDFNPIQGSESCSLSTDSLTNKINISVYPNPVSNFLNIDNSFSGNLQLKVFNQLGQIVLIQNQNTTSTSLDVSNLSKGLYYLNISSQEGHIETIKFIKN